MSCLFLVIVEVLGSAPYFLPYFNWPARLVLAPEDMLADSNLDWGQDLDRLKKYMEAQHISRIKLAYFGAGSPRELHLVHERIPGNERFCEYVQHEREWSVSESFEPGESVAISVNCLVGLSSRDRGYFKRLTQGWKRKTVIGGSIIIFVVPERS